MKKTTKYLMMFFVIFVITVNADAQWHYEATIMQAHANRLPITPQEWINLRKHSTYPDATLKNPASKNGGEMEAWRIRAANTTLTVQSQEAEYVRQTGIFQNPPFTPINDTIKYHNYETYAATHFDPFLKAMRVNVGARKPASITGSKWNSDNTVCGGFGYDASYLEGEYDLFVWDYRQATQNPKAIFIAGIVGCGNMFKEKEIIWAIMNGAATVEPIQLTQTPQATIPNNTNNPWNNNSSGNQQPPAQGYFGNPVPGGLVQNFYQYGGNGGNSSNTNSNAFPNGGNGASTQGVFLPQGQQQPNQILTPQMQGAMMQNPGLTTYTTSRGQGVSWTAATGSGAGSAWGSQDVAYVEQQLAMNNMYNKKIYQATTAGAVGAWISPLLATGLGYVLDRFAGGNNCNTWGGGQRQVPDFSPRVPNTNGSGFTTRTPGTIGG